MVLSLESGCNELGLFRRGTVGGWRCRRETAVALGISKTEPEAIFRRGVSAHSDHRQLALGFLFDDLYISIRSSCSPVAFFPLCVSSVEVYK
jgi:hypothetical protein